MGNNIPLGEDIEYFQYSGYFDWPGLYQLLSKWAKKERYKIFENLYKDKSGKGFTEREVAWYIEKKVDMMHKYSLNISIQMWDCAKVEITQNGKKVKKERGRMKIGISGNIDNDYQGLFSEGMWKILFPIYAKLTGVEFGFVHWDNLHNKRYALLNEIKTFLDTETVD